MSDLRKQLLKGKRPAYGLERISESFTDKDDPEVDPSPKRGENMMWRHEFHQMRDSLFPKKDKFYRDANHFVQTYYLPPSSDEMPVLVCHHGAGSSSSTFLAFVSELKKLSQSECPGVFLFDMFGHGKSSEREQEDFHLDALTSDFTFVVEEFIKRANPGEICFIGHSLGGSVMTNFIMNANIEGLSVSGLVLLDIVEETAVRSLSTIPSFLKTRPQKFCLYEDALNWHLQSRLLRNEESARLSIHDIFVEDDEGYLTWRSNLELMAPFWDSWFTGMSENFVRCGSSSQNIAKLLILAGDESLDKKLIIGQMQGKYQLIVFNNTTDVGHFIQEDVPSKLSISIMEFLKRHDFGYKGRKEFSIKTLWGGNVH
ncbi:hypothetical protein FT663_04752 [Candidozyma haemuli var. vulneris]|uniref:Protein phosphatase methylesterase 1 n=1 Tax=Candidozyma haemuli TaxID=45357 RepID=A0A2V1AW82_9ASCO|nr:hypothetical protein CXQ85_004787 [[Candida] haemuloni]KAF3986214.1 hypothetical protein FT662_04691 [[Candida] haemuloni var. vulneris]KAF3986758.1 hypothetical protein FT663_04752 [[Candida] haemuloni var. vulneris]PVH22118.1 hypothetical protein CXQ85_004787 [[Candida] haemuloni]